MKPNHMAITVAVPVETVARMSRLHKGNRTTTVNLAISTYLGIQGADKNRFGVDCHYFREKLLKLVERLDNYTPEELGLALQRLSIAASVRSGIDEKV